MVSHVDVMYHRNGDTHRQLGRGGIRPVRPAIRDSVGDCNQDASRRKRRAASVPGEESNPSCFAERAVSKCSVKDIGNNS
jgi:hypothetical protein